MALNPDPGVAITRAKGLVDSWHYYFQFWNVVRITLGILSILIGAITAVVAASQHPYVAAWLGVGSAVVGGLTGFLKPGMRGAAFVAAWRLVNDVLVRVQSENNHDIKELNDAMQQAEGIISQSDVH